ncbi:hypothetical protein FLM01_03495 [Vibrio cholerae]|nr:hypothetical protein FLM01_03495 [Vibrio cholerae]
MEKLDEENKCFFWRLCAHHKLTNASKGLPTRGVSSSIEPRWFRLLCLSLVVMRCQPLRRALCLSE